MAGRLDEVDDLEAATGTSLTGGGDDSHQDGRVYDPAGPAPALRSQPSRWGGPTPPAVMTAFKKGHRAGDADDYENWSEAELSDTLDANGIAPRTSTMVAGSEADELDEGKGDGMDSNRYRVIGNGVVAPVAEWLGERLAEAAEEHPWPE